MSERNVDSTARDAAYIRAAQRLVQTEPDRLINAKAKVTRESESVTVSLQFEVTDEDLPTTFITEDGLRLVQLGDGTWSDCAPDGGWTFDCDAHGHPIDLFGAPMEGRYYIGAK